MKRAVLLIFILLITVFVAGCGSRSSDSSSGSSDSSGTFARTAPVDDWTPLVQSAPGANAWRQETHEMHEPIYAPWIDREWAKHLLDHHSEEDTWRMVRSFAIQLAIYDFLSDTEWWFNTLPDYYGGMRFYPYYPSWEHWERVYVQVVESRRAEAAEFLNFLTGFEDVVIQWVDFSVAELWNLRDAIYGILRPKISDGNSNPFERHPVNWASGRNDNRVPEVWVQYGRNHVVVWLRDYTEEEKELFRQEVIDSPMIVFGDAIANGIDIINADIVRAISYGEYLHVRIDSTSD